MVGWVGGYKLREFQVRRSVFKLHTTAKGQIFEESLIMSQNLQGLQVFVNTIHRKKNIQE
jgi:hypothetical protein